MYRSPIAELPETGFLATTPVYEAGTTTRTEVRNQLLNLGVQTALWQASDAPTPPLATP